MKELKLTTVKVLKKLYEMDFKISAIKNGINFQKLVNRSLFLYTKNDIFRGYINTCDEYETSGSMKETNVI